MKISTNIKIALLPIFWTCFVLADHLVSLDVAEERAEGNAKTKCILHKKINCTLQTMYCSACSIEENANHPGKRLHTGEWTVVDMAGCASLCFGFHDCKFWTYNPK